MFSYSESSLFLFLHFISEVFLHFSSFIPQLLVS